MYNREITREIVKDALRRLSDQEHQQTAWTARSGPVVSSFIEDVCLLFDDSGLSDLLCSEEVVDVFDEVAIDQIRRLEQLIDRIDGYQRPDLLLKNPAIEDIRAQALACLQSLSRD